MGLTTQTFDVLTRIAIGNGSLVYRAVEKASLRQVALKLLKKDEEFDHCYDIGALLAAAPQIRQISGNHVCQLLDAYEDEDGPLLVYEYANGITGNEFPHRRKLDAAQAVDVAAQLMSALRSGERQQTPHGDLKPSNVIFVDTPEGRPFVFVLDWGLAAFRTELPKDSMPYLAPERLTGGAVSHQADLFAAGALLFYLLTGKVLAMGANSEELMAGWKRAKPELLADLRPDLPPKLVQWVGSLLALDSRKRPASAVDAAAALAGLNPPGPMIPPEAIRPRPLSASQRAQAAGPVSGVLAPSGSRIIAAPASSAGYAITSGARTTATASAQANSSETRHGVISPRRGKGAMVAISLSVAVAIAGTGAWWFRREKPAPLPIATVAERARAEAPVPVVSGPRIAQSSPKPPPKADAGKTSPSPKKEKEQKATAQTAKAKPSPKPVTTKTDAKAGEAKPVALTMAGKAAPTVSVAMKSEPAATPPRPNRKPDPVITESFSYADAADLEGQKAGRGWEGGWQGKGASVRKVSLNYLAHPSSGGSLLIPPSNETVSVSRAGVAMSRLLPADPKGGAHWYFAALINHSDAAPTAGGEVRLYPLELTDKANALYIGITDAGDILKVTMPGAAKSLTISSANKPLLLVCRIKVSEPKDGKWDVSASLLVDPPLAAAGFKEAGTPMVVVMKNADVPQRTGLLIRKGPGSAATVVDEVRYVAHWSDVSFKSSTPPAVPVKSSAKSAAK